MRQTVSANAVIPEAHYLVTWAGNAAISDTAITTTSV